MRCPECKKKLTNEEDCYGHDCEVDYELEEARHREANEQAKQDFFESWGRSR